MLGWRPAPGASLATAIAALVLGTAAFGGLGLAMAGRLRAEATLVVANGLFLALLLVGGILVPGAQLPSPLGDVASFLPSTPLVDTLAGALGPSDVAAPGSVAVLAAWAVVGMVVRTG